MVLGGRQTAGARSCFVGEGGHVVVGGELDRFTVRSDVHLTGKCEILRSVAVIDVLIGFV